MKAKRNRIDEMFAWHKLHEQAEQTEQDRAIAIHLRNKENWENEVRKNQAAKAEAEANDPFLKGDKFLKDLRTQQHDTVNKMVGGDDNHQKLILQNIFKNNPEAFSGMRPGDIGKIMNTPFDDYENNPIHSKENRMAFTKALGTDFENIMSLSKQGGDSAINPIGTDPSSIADTYLKKNNVKVSSDNILPDVGAPEGASNIPLVPKGLEFDDVKENKLMSRYLLDNASLFNEQATAADILNNPDAYNIGHNELDTIQGAKGAILNQMGKTGPMAYQLFPDELESYDRLRDDDTTGEDLQNAAINIAKNTQLKEQFQASGLDRRALGLFKTKDKSDLKNIIRSMVYEMADDGFGEREVENFFEKLIYAEVKMNYKKAVKTGR